MVPPDLIECRPRLGFQINSTTQSFIRTWDEFTHDTFPSNEMRVHYFEIIIAPGISNTLLTEKDAA